MKACHLQSRMVYLRRTCMTETELVRFFVSLYLHSLRDISTSQGPSALEAVSFLQSSRLRPRATSGTVPYLGVTRDLNQPGCPLYCDETTAGNVQKVR